MNNIPVPLMALNSQFSIVTLEDFCAEIVEDPPPLETVCVYSLGMYYNMTKRNIVKNANL